MGVLAMEFMLGSGCTPFDAAAPKALHPEKCIRCGHCVAVCPKGAMDHAAAPLSKQVLIGENDIPDPETAVKFLRSRRSVRVYKKEPLPKETLLRLLDIARFAPSGTNVRRLSYLVISDRDRLNRVTEATVDWLDKELNRPGSKMPAGFREPVDEYRKGRDALLRGAPHLISALTSPENLAVCADSAKFALEYVELLASAMGVGACWMGIVQLCARKRYPPLMEAMQVPEDKSVVGILTVGYPEYRYRRLVDRDPLEVHWIQ
jgi:nitroreductase